MSYLSRPYFLVHIYGEYGKDVPVSTNRPSGMGSSWGVMAECKFPLENVLDGDSRNRPCYLWPLRLHSRGGWTRFF